MQQRQSFMQIETQDAGEPRPLVLVVEDHPATQHVISTMLRLQGYQPICATNGQDALTWLEDAQIREEYPTAILLDLLMPVMDGKHFLSCLRAQWQAPVPLPPTILLTAYAGNHDALACTEVLQKPFHVKDLLASIKHVSQQG